jgi:hypothetical protein
MKGYNTLQSYLSDERGISVEGFYQMILYAMPTTPPPHNRSSYIPGPVTQCPPPPPSPYTEGGGKLGESRYAFITQAEGRKETALRKMQPYM